MKQEKKQSRVWYKALRAQGIGALLGGGVVLILARLAAGVLAKGESFEGALPILGWVLPFVGGLAAGGFGLWLSKGGLADGLAAGGILLGLFLLGGVFMGQRELSLGMAALRASGIPLGALGIPWLVFLSQNKRKSSRSAAKRWGAKGKKS